MTLVILVFIWGNGLLDTALVDTPLDIDELEEKVEHACLFLEEVRAMDEYTVADILNVLKEWRLITEIPAAEVVVPL